MVNVLEQLGETLHRAGYSLTLPRKLVLGALQHTAPQTMAEIVAKCISIDRASIYRTITLYEKLGIVQRLQIGWKYKLELSDRFQEHHHHLHCTGCGRVVSLPEDSSLEATMHAMAARHDFKLESHQLELSGLCLACQKAS
jgi:Fur family ferric uptake transcriptional regulator